MNVIKPEIKFSDIQADPQLREMAFFYVIDDIIPELLPGIAYRRVGAEEQHKRKILKCPFCASRLTDMDAGTKVELFGHAKRVIVKCQFYIRCFQCHKEVGIKLALA
ncbi:hypothetical protein FACS1894202_02470 [Clostridia bacterium]|nr:hypothetical protein FACS1894202_02470 [Clostridia bacterium]